MTVAPESIFGQVKLCLLPLSPLASTLERVIERLPRCLIRVELKPINEVAVINESKGAYKATGNMPSFEMTLAPTSLHSGWYYLEAALVRNNGNREANIRAYIRGEGKKSITIPIPTNLRGTAREVFYLPQNVTALHWSPTAAPGYFSQSPLLLHKISPLESTIRRISRVLFDLWRFRGRAPAARAGLTWCGALNLQDAYQRTANLRIKRAMGNDYSAFIALRDTLKKADIRAMHKQIPQLALRPIISLIMPVQSPIIMEFFRGALDSVSGQIYPHWELLLTGNFSADAQSFAIANEYASKDARIRIVSVKSGENLAVTFNSALDLAQGEFVARINQHDRLPQHALFLLAQEISKYPDADLIYTDEDSIDDTNQRLDPRFKPDWNPDLFFSYNYVGNLTLYRRMPVLELGGYQPGFEGAEDYNLSLRYLRNIPTTKIRHIPRVLYHSRTTIKHYIIRGNYSVRPEVSKGEMNAMTISQPLPSTPSPLRGESSGEGSAHQSGKRALENYFNGSGITVTDGAAPTLYRIKHSLPPQLPLVSIIIPTRDKVEFLKACIESIQQKTDYANWEMLVVDNQSVEPATLSYLEKIKGDSRIKVITYENSFNYSAMNNFAVQHSKGEILALLNNDVEVISNEWLSEMVSHAVRPEVGAVGAKLLYSNGMVQHAGVIIGLGGVAGHAHKYLKGDDHGYCHRAIVTQNLSAVTGACLIVRKSCYQEVRGFNETELAVAFNDVDFCLQLIATGYRNVFTPHALLYHHESISRGHNDTAEKHALFVQEFEYMKNTWVKRLQQDPAYNPNLTSEFEDFSLGVTPS